MRTLIGFWILLYSPVIITAAIVRFVWLAVELGWELPDKMIEDYVKSR